MNLPGSPLTRILLTALAVIGACQVAAWFLSEYFRELCVLLLLVILARTVWFYTNWWR